MVPRLKLPYEYLTPLHPAAAEYLSTSQAFQGKTFVAHLKLIVLSGLLKKIREAAVLTTV